MMRKVSGFKHSTALFLLVLTFAAAISGCSGRTQGGASGTELHTERWERGPYSLELTYPAAAVDFGTTVELSLRISCPEAEPFILLPPDTNNEEIYSNTVILSVDERAPVPDGSGLATTVTAFSLEAWLPGEIAFPPLTVRFGAEGQELSTEAVRIPAISAFDGADAEADGDAATGSDTGGDTAGRELAPLYIPQPGSGLSRRNILLIASALPAAVAIGITVVLIMRRRKNNKASEPAPKTRLQLLVDFRRRYIDAGGPVDLRAAYSELVPLLDHRQLEQFRELIEEARFSRDGINYTDGYRQLVQIFGSLAAGAGSSGEADASEPNELLKLPESPEGGQQ